MSNYTNKIRADLANIDEQIDALTADLAALDYELYSIITTPPQPDGNGSLTSRLSNILKKAAQTTEQRDALASDQQLVHQIAAGELAPRLMREKRDQLQDLVNRAQDLVTRANVQLQAVSSGMRSAENGRSAGFDALRRRGYSDAELNALNAALQAEKGK